MIGNENLSNTYEKLKMFSQQCKTHNSGSFSYHGFFSTLYILRQFSQILESKSNWSELLNIIEIANLALFSNVNFKFLIIFLEETIGRDLLTSFFLLRNSKTQQKLSIFPCEGSLNI